MKSRWTATCTPFVPCPETGKAYGATGRTFRTKTTNGLVWKIQLSFTTQTPVRDLNFDLKRLQKAHDDGSHGTRPARSYALAQAADTLHELGFRGFGHRAAA